jgi:ketosteroid isomerase-like protein
MSAMSITPRRDHCFIRMCWPSAPTTTSSPASSKWIKTQWDNVWPKTSDFRFTLEQSQVLASPDGKMAIVIAPWTSTGYQPDGKPFPRPGRATMVFSKFADGWLCTHSHMSLNRGVPQASHANRPVTAW